MLLRSTCSSKAFTLMAWIATGGAFASGQDLVQTTQLHGFGSWHYGHTSAPNLYLGGSPDGEYSNSRLALNASAGLSSRLFVSTQLEVVSGGDFVKESEVELDYAFASWRFADAFVLRAGSVKLPFGVSSEVFDVGTLRPFLDLPRSVYGPVGNVAERYQGLGFTGALHRGGWSVRYDGYFGGLNMQEYEAPEVVLRSKGGPTPELNQGLESFDLRDAVGAHVVIDTSVSGLSFGASAYTGTEEMGESRTAWGAQAEYLYGPWSLRSEYVGGAHGDETRDSFYFEAARRFGAWQAAGRYEWFDSRLEAVPESGSLLRHESWSLALNYWFSSEFVIKANYHRVDGNRLAGPPADTLAALFASGRLKARTNAFQLGAQFSF